MSGYVVHVHRVLNPAGPYRALLLLDESGRLDAWIRDLVPGFARRYLADVGVWEVMLSEAATALLAARHAVGAFCEVCGAPGRGACDAWQRRIGPPRLATAAATARPFETPPVSPFGSPPRAAVSAAPPPREESPFGAPAADPARGATYAPAPEPFASPRSRARPRPRAAASRRRAWHENPSPPPAAKRAKSPPPPPPPPPPPRRPRERPNGRAETPPAPDAAPRAAAALLGLPWPCDAADARRAFEARALACHPDHGGTDDAMRSLLAARAALTAHFTARSVDGAAPDARPRPTPSRAAASR